MDLLEVKDICKITGGEEVLKHISFTQKELQKLAVSGETGSGKSTLLRIIAGLAQPDSGEVIFNGERVEGPAEKLVPGHDEIAYLSQYFELQKFLRVEQVLSYSNVLDDSEAERLYRICRIDHLMEHKTDQLSGGERQRIALARLLSTSPKMLLLDEPFSNLDLSSKNIIKAVIEDVIEQYEITCILVSHDPQDVLSWAEHIIILRNGKIIQKGTPKEIYYNPNDEYVAGLFGKYNLIQRTNLKTFIKGNDRQLIRPEEFIISKNPNSVLKGKVIENKFFGTHYELIVDIHDQKFTIRTSEGNYKKGVIIGIEINQFG